MLKSAGIPLLWLLTVIFAAAEPPPASAPAAQEPPVLREESPGKKKVVYVIPVRGEIAKPVFYILRRGLKDAIDHKADAVLLDMSTPGGELGVTFEIMEALGKYSGDTLTYVD